MTAASDALERARGRWNAGDLDGYLELYDDRIQLHGYSPQPMSKAEVREFYRGIFDAFEQMRLEFGEILWSGSSCAFQFTMTGRHAGPFMGVPATGLPIALPGITILHFDGPRVRERYSQSDMLGLLIQIGAVPAPA